MLTWAQLAGDLLGVERERERQQVRERERETRSVHPHSTICETYAV